jgi:tetratricopeptide (TPR) repeat protein
MGKFKVVIRKCSKLLEMNPNLRQVLLTRGNTYAELHQYTKALRDYEELLRQDPFFGHGWHNKSIVLNKLGRTEEAHEAFEMSEMLK